MPPIFVRTSPDSRHEGDRRDDLRSVPKADECVATSSVVGLLGKHELGCPARVRLRQAHNGEVLGLSRPEPRRLAHLDLCRNCSVVVSMPPTCGASLGRRSLHVRNELGNLAHSIAIPIAVPNRIEKGAGEECMARALNLIGVWPERLSHPLNSFSPTGS